MTANDVLRAMEMMEMSDLRSMLGDLLEMHQNKN